MWVSDFPNRPRIVIGSKVTMKRHRTAADADNEARWLVRVPWAAPKLLRVRHHIIYMETLTCSWHLPGWQPVDDLRALIVRLHKAGIHHRDVHPGNVVQGRDGLPRLIDWESAVEQKTDQSYDLVGRASGVPDPERHRLAEYSQWWSSSSPCSIEKMWINDVPT